MASLKKDAIQKCARVVLEKTGGKKKPTGEDPTMATLLEFDDMVQICVSVVESLSEQLIRTRTDYGGKGPEDGKESTIDRALLKESVQGDLLTEAMNSGANVSLAKQYDLASGFAAEFSEHIDNFVLCPSEGAPTRKRGIKTARVVEAPPLEDDVDHSDGEDTPQQQTQAPGGVGSGVGHPSIYDEATTQQETNKNQNQRQEKTNKKKTAGSRAEVIKTGEEDDWRSKRRRLEVTEGDRKERQEGGNGPVGGKGKFASCPFPYAPGGPLHGKKPPALGPRPSSPMVGGVAANGTVPNKNTSGCDDSWGSGLLAAPVPNGGALLAAPSTPITTGGLLAPPPAFGGFATHSNNNIGFFPPPPPRCVADGWGDGGTPAVVAAPLPPPPPPAYNTFGNMPGMLGASGHPGFGHFHPQQQQQQQAPVVRQRANPDQRFVVVENVENKGTERQLSSFLFNSLNYFAQGDDDVKKILNLVVLPMSKILELQGRKPMEEVTAAEFAKKKDTKKYNEAPGEASSSAEAAGSAGDSAPSNNQEETAANNTSPTMKFSKPATPELWGCVASMKHPQIAMTMLRHPFSLSGQDQAILRAATAEEILLFREENSGRVVDAEKTIATAMETQAKKWELRALLSSKADKLQEEVDKMSIEVVALKAAETPETAATIVVQEAKCETLKDQVAKLQGQLRSLGNAPSYSNCSTQPRHAGNIYLLDVGLKLADQQVQIIFNAAFPMVQTMNLWRDSDGGHNLCVALGGFDQPQKIMAFLDATNYELKVSVIPTGGEGEQGTIAPPDNCEAQEFKIRFTQYNPDSKGQTQ